MAVVIASKLSALSSLATCSQTMALQSPSNDLCIACRQAWLWFGKLIGIAAVLWVSLGAVQSWVQPVSRRACNMSYVLLSLAMNWTLLLLFLLSSVLSHTVLPLELLAACSWNMLPLFLLANILTGAINLSINSLTVSDVQALCIVSIYTVSVCCAAKLLWAKKLQIKLDLSVCKAKLL